MFAECYSSNLRVNPTFSRRFTKSKMPTITVTISSEEIAAF